MKNLFLEKTSSAIRPPSATVLDVEHNGFRISLRDIQQVPEYAELIDECLDEVEQIIGSREGGMRRRTGYLFITAPASNTPMHFGWQECNHGDTASGDYKTVVRRDSVEVFSGTFSLAAQTCTWRYIDLSGSGAGS